MIPITFVSESEQWGFKMPAVPRVGDTVLLRGVHRRVMRVLWIPDRASDQQITVFLGEQR